MTGTSVNPGPKEMDRQVFGLLRIGLLGFGVACSLLGFLVTRFASSPSVTPAATGSPSLPPPESVAVTCARLGPLLDAGNRESVALLTGAQAPPDIDLRATIAGLRSAEPLAPAAWRPDIAVQYHTLRQLADAHGDQAKLVTVRYEEFAAAGSRLLSDCEGSATASAAG